MCSPWRGSVESRFFFIYFTFAGVYRYIDVHYIELLLYSREYQEFRQLLARELHKRMVIGPG